MIPDLDTVDVFLLQKGDDLSGQVGFLADDNMSAQCQQFFSETSNQVDLGFFRCLGFNSYFCLFYFSVIRVLRIFTVKPVTERFHRWAWEVLAVTPACKGRKIHPG